MGWPLSDCDHIRPISHFFLQRFSSARGFQKFGNLWSKWKKNCGPYTQSLELSLRILKTCFIIFDLLFDCCLVKGEFKEWVFIKLFSNHLLQRKEIFTKFMRVLDKWFDVSSVLTYLVIISSWSYKKPNVFLFSLSFFIPNQSLCSLKCYRKFGEAVPKF